MSIFCVGGGEFFRYAQNPPPPTQNIDTIAVTGVGFTKKYQPKYLINNAREKTYITTVEIQEWAAKNALSKIFENGVIKFAIIENRKYYAQCIV